MNNYQKSAIEFQKEITNDINLIYTKHNHNLNLELSSTNVLSQKSSVNGSTAIGFILEEFLILNLLKLKPKLYYRSKASTNDGSYDLYAKKNNIKILINLKVNKSKGSNNNAISALTKLITDYCLDGEQKLFLVFKTYYDVDTSIKIKKTFSYFIEQILPQYIKIDNRRWSENSNELNGRVNYNYSKGLLKLSEISYEKTVQKIYNFRDLIKKRT